MAQGRMNVIGDRYGRWTVIAEASPIRQRTTNGRSAIRRRCLCVCRCGTKKIVRLEALRSGGSRSCGCLQTESRLTSTLKHGHKRNRKHSPTYNSWIGMLQRCTNPKNKHYKDYAGRGVVICDRWLDFANFLADMGERPAGKTIDRIDNNGNYEPGNCRWATQIVQANNTRSNHYITYNGHTLSLSDWARTLGIHRDTLRHRLKNWPLCDALTKRNRNHQSRAARREL